MVTKERDLAVLEQGCDARRQPDDAERNLPVVTTEWRRISDLLLARLGDAAWPEAGYVIESDETDDHVPHDTAFCWEHAEMVAVGDSIITGDEMFPMNISQSETDTQEWCAFHGCSKALNTGSPTDHWIDSALGLTEEDPFACHVTPYELSRSACNMTHDDPRWPVWIRQAKRTLRRKRTTRPTQKDG